MVDDVKLIKGLESWFSFLEKEQFVVDQGRVLCLRETCEGCEYSGDCEYQDAYIYTQPLPVPRRVIGFEQKTFLVLKLKEGVSIKDIPKGVITQPYVEESMSPYNNHFILKKGLEQDPIWVIKGQIRFYGTEEEYLRHDISEYTILHDRYEPKLKILSCDVKQQEPKLSALVPPGGVKKWLEVFRGQPKVYAKKVKPKKDFVADSLRCIGGEVYCILLGEVNKPEITFSSQCLNCGGSCEVLKEFYKNIEKDWHLENAFSFFPQVFKNRTTEGVDKDNVKYLRSLAKAGGLLCLSGDVLLQVRVSKKIKSEKSSECGVHYTNLEIKLKDLVSSFVSLKGSLEVKTDTGFVLVKNAWSSGLKERCFLKLENGLSLACAATHLIEVSPSVFKELQQLQEGDFVLTEQGRTRVKSVEYLGFLEEMFDIEVCTEKGQFFANGVSVHNTNYGGGPWRLSSVLKCSEADAKRYQDNFFSDLPDLKAYMEKAQTEVFKSAKVSNLFGRERSMQEDIKKKDWGRVKRAALNHPIQSTASDFIKLSMLRAVDYIHKRGFYPLSGLGVPQNLGGCAHSQIMLALFLTVHDEIDFWVNFEQIEDILPSLYEVLQLKDVMASFQAGFDFDMDLEYDEYGSFTSTKQYPLAEVFLRLQLSGLSLSEEREEKPNAILLEEELTLKNFELIKSLPVCESDYEGAFNESLTPLYLVVEREKFYIHTEKFILSVFKTLGLKFKLIYLKILELEKK